MGGAPAILELQHCSDPVLTTHDPVLMKRYRMVDDALKQMAAALVGSPDIEHDPRLEGRLLDLEKVSIDLLRLWIRTCERKDADTCGSAGLRRLDTSETLMID